MNLVETRRVLKQKLLHHATALGQKALFPDENSEIDTIIQQLETLNPTPLPLALENRPLLLGDWTLIYASRGTVVTRQLWGGIRINGIWQTLCASTEAAISVGNGIELELPLLGRLQVQAQGMWRSQAGTQIAAVAFDAFSMQATHLFHQSAWQLPTLHVPVLEWLRREASWQTPYLDSELRIGLGVTGNRFVFVKSL